MIDVVITGGASGIGLAIADRFRYYGMKSLVLDRKEPEREELEHAFALCDVAERSGLERAVRDTSIQILVVAAGVTSQTNYPETWEFREMTAVNVDGVRNTLDAVGPKLKQGGRLIYIGSHDPPRAAYADSKAKGEKLIRTFLEKRRPDICAFLAQCGPVDTELFRKGKDFREVQRTQGSVGVFEPHEIATKILNMVMRPGGGRAGVEEEVFYKNPEAIPTKKGEGQ